MTLQMLAPDQYYQLQQEQALLQAQFPPPQSHQFIFNDGTNVMYATNDLLPQQQLPQQSMHFNHHMPYLHQIDANTFVPMEIVTPVMMDYGTALANPDWLAAPQFYPPLPVEAIPLPPLQPANYFVHADEHGQLVFSLMQGLQQMSLGNEIPQNIMQQNIMQFTQEPSVSNAPTQSFQPMSANGLTQVGPSTIPVESAIVKSKSAETTQPSNHPTAQHVIKPIAPTNSLKIPSTTAKIAGDSSTNANPDSQPSQASSDLLSKAREAVRAICEVGPSVIQANPNVADSTTTVPKPRRIYKRKMASGPSSSCQANGDNEGHYTPLAQKRCKSKYSEEDLQAAVDDINSGRLSVARAAHKYGIPSGSVYYMLKKHNRRMGEGEAETKCDESNNNQEQAKEERAKVEKTVKLPSIKKKKYTEENLKLALEAVSQGRMNQRQASLAHEIPYSTLRHQVLIYSKTEGGAKQYTEDDSSRALEAIRSGEINPWQASKQFGIPYPTIYNRAKRSMLLHTQAPIPTARPSTPVPDPVAAEPPVPAPVPEPEAPAPDVKPALDLPVPLRRIKTEPIEVIELDD